MSDSREYRVKSICFFQEESIIEIVKSYPSNRMLLSNPPKPAPDEVEKEIYGVVDGKIALIKTIKGHHEPAYLVSESFTFPDDHQ